MTCRSRLSRLRSAHRPLFPPFPRAPALVGSPRISIIVNNHNYDRFLSSAIDSALDQRGADVEVIVVDDGSDDGSREVIASYGDRVRTVLQDNLGQKAAFNAGFTAASGDVVIFLDADDLLEPGTAAAVSRAFMNQAATARVVFRLAVVDEDGRRTGGHLPPDRKVLPHGDVRAAVCSHPDDLAWPPTSGNAFAAWVLKQILPLPIDDERTGADHDLHTLVPLFGLVVALSGVRGSYRIHGRNAHARQGFDLVRSRRILRRSQRSQIAVVELARELGYPAARPRSVSIAAHRLLSVRCDPSGHPVPNDSRTGAMLGGLAASWGRDDVGVLRRAMFTVWFLLTWLAPVALLGPLADMTSQGMQRRRPKLRR